ncbi:MAG: hypothetical protein EOT05_03080 [Candidatus Microsaccharimonas sossegonensis]|uniref:Uncharacterized protein n=1 Tax=Candidatus Microsaccharimonas sossegonensis TaxID=2506948 RepID=A0A4Q0AI44_9BACT|nr:MAG: hypothetical protein EOT05_03080 [Candidatus Microsaccharimonas sossegonensis]
MSEYSFEFGTLPEHEKALLAEFERVSLNARGEPLTWGTTPLVNTPEVVLQQNDVKSQIAALFENGNIPRYVSKNLAEYIAVLNMSRTYNRENHNRNSYAYRGKTDLDGVPLEAQEVINRALMGFASPAELLLIARNLEIPTIELASLTHPYGQRIEMLEPMRAAVNDAVDIFGGQRVIDQMPVYTVKGSDNPHDPTIMEGIHTTRKRIIGVLPDTTELMERSSFVLLVNNLPKEVTDKIRLVSYGATWADEVLHSQDLDVLIPVLLEENVYDTAIPISTTVVAINPILEKRLLSGDAMRERNRQYIDAHQRKI